MALGIEGQPAGERAPDSGTPEARTEKSDFKNESEPRLSNWHNGLIIKDFTLHSQGPGFMPYDDGLPDPPDIVSLPAGWEIDENGYFHGHFPAVQVKRKDFVQGEREAFPAYLITARLSGSTSWSRFKMNAGNVALKFHHFMGDNVPGFWDAYNYKPGQYPDKVFRLTFENQGEIIFYGTHGGYWGAHAKHDDRNAMFVVKNGDKSVRLMFESNVAEPHRDLSYPGQQDVKHVGFNLPTKNVYADNIISAFAIINALGHANQKDILKSPSDRPQSGMKPQGFFR